MPLQHDEIIQIVDRQNRKIGHQQRSRMRAEGFIPRASYILVFNDRNEIFVQKRTLTKDIYPGFWDVAAGGVVLAEESYEDSARRELAEELGVSEVPLHFAFDHYYETDGNRVWGRVFTCRHNGPFILQESEVAGGMFLPVDQALRLKDREPVTPDGVEILQKHVKMQESPPPSLFFLHGLDSSGKGTKGKFFSEHFPHIHCPDFTGTLSDRLQRLTKLCRDRDNLTFIASSFGGLMATCFAKQFPTRVTRLLLLAPALNYGAYRPPGEKLSVPTLLVIGKEDTVTPAELVIPLARQTFASLEIRTVDDDHMLHRTFAALPWHELLML